MKTLLCAAEDLAAEAGGAISPQDGGASDEHGKRPVGVSDSPSRAGHDQQGGTSHIGSIFSMADIIAVLYADVLRYDPQNPKMPERDRFVLARAHAGAVYAALAECGFFPVKELELHCQNGSPFSGHVSHKWHPRGGGLHGPFGPRHAHGHGHGHSRRLTARATGCTASSGTGVRRGGRGIRPHRPPV